MRSFALAWRHRYLWLLALFAGESGGFSFSYSQGTRASTTSTGTGQHLATWVGQHAGLLVAIAIVWVLAVVALFVLAAVCEGGLIRGAAEHDADRAFRLGQAWRSGVKTMWLIVRFRLLLIALVLPAFVAFGLLVVGFVLAVSYSNVGLAILLGIVGVLFLVLLIVYSIYISLLDRLGSRTAILEETQAWPAIVRAHRLLTKRLGRVLLVWLLSVVVGVVVGIVSTIVLVVVLLPSIISLLVIVAGGPGWLWLVFVLGTLVFLVVAIPLSAFLATQASTYWTLSFRRIDLDFGPVTPPLAAA